MGFLPPLRSDLSHYRKRKQISLDGTVAGIECNHYRRGYDKPLFGHSSSTGPALPDLMYDPHPGLPEFHEPEYRAYEADLPQLRTPPIGSPLPDFPDVESPPRYSACLMTNELFQQLMEEFGTHQEVAEALPFDQDVRAQEIMHASPEEPAVGPLSYDPIREIDNAMDQQKEQMSSQFAGPEPPPIPDYPPAPPPMYEDELQQRMNPFGMMMGPGPMM